MGETLDFATLRDRNVARCEEAFHPLHDWTPTDWACALAGEVGEACNLVKKLRRMVAPGSAVVALGHLQDGTAERLVGDIADELADAVIYADLLAARLHVDLGAAVRRTFNRTSRAVGSDVTL